MFSHLLIVAVVIISLCLYYFYYHNSQVKQYSCVCAFDLDQTLTCGISKAADAIKTCKYNNCKIAINTARPTPWYSDIKMSELGLTPEDFEDDFYHGEPFECSFLDHNCLHDKIANTKIKHLGTLSKKWNIDRQKVILFDDQYTNILKARNEGFSAIHANHTVCGMPDDVYQQINELLN